MYTGLKNYLHHFGVPYFHYSIGVPQNPILIIKAPILAFGAYGLGLRQRMGAFHRHLWIWRCELGSCPACQETARTNPRSYTAFASMASYSLLYSRIPYCNI